MAFPLLAAGALGGKLLSGFLKGKGEKKKAESQRKAQESLYGARKGQWEASEARRGEKLNAIQGLLQRLGLSLPEGAPDYSFDPTVLASLQKTLPFAETIESQMVGGDPRAGAGYGAAAGLVGGLGEAANTALLAGGSPTPATEAPATLPTQNVTESVFTPELLEKILGGR